MALNPRQNPWLRDAYRKSMVSVSITSLNLHGTGRRKGFIRPEEVFTTMFKMNIRLGRDCGHEWTQSRTFNEFRDFFQRLVTTGGANVKEKLTVPFPEGKDGDADVFILLERKDEMEALIKDVVANLDFLLYAPLFAFLGAEAGLDLYVESLTLAQALVRSYIRRKSVLKELCHKYEDEQRRLFHMLTGRDGIQVVAIASEPYQEATSHTVTHKLPSFRRRVLWLELNKTSYALSLLCVASVKRFKAAKSNKDWLSTSYDPRKYTIIPLCDIAEVRRGPCSRAFRAFPRQSMIDPKLCLVVVSSVTSMNLQVVARSGVERDWLLDSLAMLANNSLSHAEARLRGRRWRRYHNVKTLLRVPRNKVHLSKGRQKEATKMKKLLLGVIDVEEELCEFRGPQRTNMAVPLSISENVLWFDESSRRLFLSSDLKNKDLPVGERWSPRGVDIDDIAEIRPGRMSFDVDGNDIEPMLCIIGSETVIRLPMDSVSKRNKLISYFQSFVWMYKNHEFACSDQWAPFRRDDNETMQRSPVDSVPNPVKSASGTSLMQPPVVEEKEGKSKEITGTVIRRGSRTLEECMTEMLDTPDNIIEESETISQPIPAVTLKSRDQRGESWSGIMSGNYCIIFALAHY